MTEVLTADQMRALEREAIESGRVTGLELMERAGAGAVEAILDEWPELQEGERRAVVLCGPGGNGGDGFVVARLLRERGWAVDVFLYGDPDRLPPDTRANYERWVEKGVVELFDDAAYEEDLHGSSKPDLLVDAILGIGLKRPATDFSTLFHYVEDVVKYKASDTKVVSLDIPTGLRSDTGETIPIDGAVPPHVIVPHLTVTFHRRKTGHLLGWGPLICGKIRSVDIGLPNGKSDLILVAQPNIAKRRGHKYDHGHALVLSGGVGRGGAARLAARAALRVGAGAVTLGCPPSALMENAIALPDAVMTRAVRDAAALREALGDARINAVCLGPGLGMGQREAALLDAALDPGREGEAPTLVLDGDALTLLAGHGGIRAKLRAGHVLTPHMGEFARLVPGLAARLRTDGAYSKVDAARDAAEWLNATVLLKGPDTVIARPDGRAAIHSAEGERAAPWLATAGAGDVLAGMICGVLARGLDPFGAACAAAWLHVEAARAFGPGLTADDLPEALPGVLAGLEGAPS